VTFGLSAETLEKTTLATLKPRSRVNIERAMPAGGRFGGHIVQGHVDGTGTIRAVKQQDDFADIEVGVGSELLGQMVSKGSVAVDGVSLTIAALGREIFRVAAIPEALRRTTLGTARIGQRVKIEIDVIVKAVRRQLEQMLGQSSLTVERLKEMGF
jgi:riboflavin synthase